MILKKRIGLRIQELRLKKGLKQSELAKRVGIATKHQSCIETGKNFPSAELIEKFSVALDVDVSEILNISHIQSRENLYKDILKSVEEASDDEIILIHKFINTIKH